MKLSRPGLDSACLDWNYSELNWLRGIILGNCLTKTFCIELWEGIVWDGIIRGGIVRGGIVWDGIFQGGIVWGGIVWDGIV